MHHYHYIPIKNTTNWTIVSIPNLHHNTVIFTHLFTHDSIQQNLFHPQPTQPTQPIQPSNSTNPTIQLLNPNPYLKDIKNPTPQPTTHPTNQPTHTLRILCMWRVAIKSGLAIWVAKPKPWCGRWARAATWSSNVVLFTSRLFPSNLLVILFRF